MCGGVWTRKSTPITKPGKIVLTPNKGEKGEEKGRREPKRTPANQDRDAADGPWAGRVENEGMKGQRQGRQSDRDDKKNTVKSG